MASIVPTFDLTVTDGARIALKLVAAHQGLAAGYGLWWLGATTALGTPVAPVLLPAAIAAGAWYLAGRLREPGEVSVDKQLEAVKEIIRAGKLGDVDHITLKVSRDVGLKIGSEFEGVPIKMSIGISGEVYLEIKFK